MQQGRMKGTHVAAFLSLSAASATSAMLIWGRLSLSHWLRQLLQEATQLEAFQGLPARSCSRRSTLSAPPPPALPTTKAGRMSRCSAL